MTDLVSAHIGKVEGPFGFDVPASSGLNQPALPDAVADRIFYDDVSNPDHCDCEHDQDCKAENCLPLHRDFKSANIHSVTPCVVEAGVYADEDFRRDFSAAMLKGGQLCKPPAQAVVSGASAAPVPVVSDFK